MDEVLVVDYIELIEYLEMCRYSPKKGDKINKDLYSKVFNVVNKIDSMV